MSGLARLDPEALFAPVAGYEKLGLAVSGGPDLLALMLLAAAWARGEDRPQLIVYTVDHGLRPEAAGEAAMVLREAEKLGIVAHALRWLGPHPATGLQAAARSARYGLMAEAMEADGAEILLTAHHLADQAETVLMRLAHGSGIDGLRGMDVLSVVEGCKIFRPLLGIDPLTLREIVAARGLVAADDPSNRDLSYERVRWRQMLPALTELGLDMPRLGRFAGRMADATRLIEGAAEGARTNLVEPFGAHGFRLPHAEFGRLNALVKVRLLGQLLEQASGSGRSPPLGALEALCGRLGNAAPRKPETLNGCVISSDGERLQIVREGPRTAVLKGQRALTAN